MKTKDYTNGSPTLAHLKEYKRQALKDLLASVTEPQQFFFKRMYSPKDLNKPIDSVVDHMPEDKLDWAIQQCETQIKKNKAENK